MGSVMVACVAAGASIRAGEACSQLAICGCLATGIGLDDFA